MNPRISAYVTVDETMDEGLAQGHPQDGWKTEPIAMHLLKASRHGQTCALLLEHPEYCKDRETALEHAKRMLTRAAFVVSILEGSHEG